MLDCVKKTMPVWKTYEELSDCVEKEEESMAEAIDIIDAMEGESRKNSISLPQCQVMNWCQIIYLEAIRAIQYNK